MTTAYATTVVLSVSVTQADIDKSDRESMLPSTDCPVARALNRLGMWVAHVGTEGATLVIPETYDEWRCILPPTVRRFVRNFDCLEAVEPFTADLEFLFVSSGEE